MNDRRSTSNRSSKNRLISIDIDKEDRGSNAGKWAPRTREEDLGLELALTLQDREGLPFYISCSTKYPEPLLRKILERVMGVPDTKIKKSRGALFNYLLNKPL